MESPGSRPCHRHQRHPLRWVGYKQRGWDTVTRLHPLVSHSTHQQAQGLEEISPVGDVFGRKGKRAATEGGRGDGDVAGGRSSTGPGGV